MQLLWTFVLLSGALSQTGFASYVASRPPSMSDVVSTSQVTVEPELTAMPAVPSMPVEPSMPAEPMLTEMPAVPAPSTAPAAYIANPPPSTVSPAPFIPSSPAPVIPVVAPSPPSQDLVDIEFVLVLPEPTSSETLVEAEQTSEVAKSESCSESDSQEIDMTS
ncbi:hypothetical protein IW139_003068, partial [Coemansia sp. RSA 353]